MVKFTKNKKVYEENINNLPTRASAIVFPDSNQEIKNIIKLSPKEMDIVSRGFGVSFSGASSPLEKNNSVIIDFSKMNKILDINIVTKTAIVEPGVLVSDLNEELFKYDLEFPIIPMFQGLETIGSMIAKNSSGSREVKYNRTINWLESLEIITGKGEEMKISKSDLSDFVGTEGTTGIITKVILRLTNKRKRSITILKSDNLKEIFIANRRLRLKQDVCSIDFFNKQISLLLGLENKYHLFVEFDSEEGSFKSEEYGNFVKLKSKAYKKIAGEGFYLLDSLKLFSETLEDYFIYLEEKKIPYFAFLASGVVFICSRNDEKDKNKIYEALILGAKLKAKISPTLGYGFTRKDFLEKGEADLLARVKFRHDPNNRLNKDKFIDYNKKIERKREITEEINDEEVRVPEFVKKDEEEKQKTLGEIIEASEFEKKELEQKFEEKKEKQKIETMNKSAQEMIDNTYTFPARKKEELSEEEKEKVKKIASGFFGANRDNKTNNDN